MPNLVRIVIQLPVNLKTQLDNLKQQGYTTCDFIRAMHVGTRVCQKGGETCATPSSWETSELPVAACDTTDHVIMREGLARG